MPLSIAVFAIFEKLDIVFIIEYVFFKSQKVSISWNAFCCNKTSLISLATSKVNCCLSGRASEPTSCTISISFSSSCSMAILQEEEKLIEIVQLVGSDALPERQQLTLLVARLIREVLLQQNAFHEIDTFCDLKKTYSIMKTISNFSKMANTAMDSGMRVHQILATKAKDRLGEVKFVKDHEKLLDELARQMEKELKV